MADRRVGVLVVGGGVAAASCAGTLRQEGYEGEVLVCGREPDAPYERPPCSKDYLQGAASRADLLLRPGEWWEQNGIELRTRTSVMRLDTAQGVARLSTKEEVAFDHAVLATGANVRRLAVDGAQLEGLHHLRSLANADAIRTDAQDAERVVLVGGSYIACEVAASLTTMGLRCTLVGLEELPLSTQFGPDVGRFFAGVLEEHGVEWLGGEPVAAFTGGGERVEGVVTASGRTLPADLVVLGAGVVPDVMLARAAGLELGATGGVACDRRLATSTPGVWAAGDVCEYDSVLHGRRVRIEHWDVAGSQGAHVARAILGSEDPYAVVPGFWSDLADWCSLRTVGTWSSHDETDIEGDIASGSFLARYRQGGRLVGALAVGSAIDQLAATEVELAPSS